MQLPAQTIRVITQTLSLPGSHPRRVALVAIAPPRRLVAVVGEGREGSVVGQLRLEGPARGELEELSFGGRDEVAASIALHPPAVLGELVEGVHDEVGVGVIDAGVIAALLSGKCHFVSAMYRWIDSIESAERW